MTPAIIEAQRKYRAAAEELAAVVEKALPCGARVSVKMGKTTVIGTVKSHAGNWYQPSQVTITNDRTGNDRTGKRRNFTAASMEPSEAVILSLP